MSNRSDAARHAPCTKPKVPTGISGWLWNASARSTVGPSITPSSIIAFMPPIPSSAGWNTSFTVPASCGASSFSTAATPSSVVVWMSWPQACIRPGLVLANGRPDVSSIGSASMSARIASTGPGRPPSIRPTTPVRPMPVWWPMPRRVEFARDDAGGADLLEAEFRMGVDVAADLDQRRFDALGGVADRGGGIVAQDYGT